MKSFVLAPLTHAGATVYQDALAILDESVRQAMGREYVDEEWTPQHFTSDVPGKWRFSQLGLAETKQVAGFWIASHGGQPAVGVYSHRIAVDPEYRSCGMGKAMFVAVQALARQHGIGRISLSVSVTNIRALRFYRREGFVVLTDQDLREYVEAKGIRAKILSDCVEESNGHRKHICILPLHG